MSQKLRPLFNRVVVKPILEQMKGGLVIPVTAQEKPEIGKLVSVGDGVKANLKVGDTVLFGKFSGAPIKVDEENLLFMRDEDILAVLDEVAANVTA